jgi:MFS family permease
MSHPDDVPGTILLWDESHHGNDLGHRGEVVLQPQPSADPEDPLNWSRRRKLVAISMTYLYVLGVGICTTVHYSVLTQIAEAQALTVSQLNLGTGLMFLFLGWGNLFWQPLATTYGRRGVYLVSIILCIPPVLWTPFSHGPSQWYAHRIILGFIAAPIESLPELSVPDLFFAHERGSYMAVYALMLFGSNFIAPFLAGFILDGAGWHWVMYFAAIWVLFCSTILFFFMEETIYFRNTTETDVVAVDEKTGMAETTQEEVSFPPPRTYVQKLKLVLLLPGRPTPKQTLMKVWRTFKILYWFPNITWAGLLYGTNLAWYMVINGTMSSILGGEPYNFAPAMVGTAYLSPLVASSFASLWSGWFADKIALRLARRNKGIREPEHRLWALPLSALMSTGGLIMWGVGASHDLHFMGLIFGIGFTTFGVVCGGAIALAYTVDCFKEIAGESLIAVILIRNTLGFAFGYAINPWIDSLGLQNCFISVSMISLFVTGTFLCMIVWGKRLRKFSAGRYWSYVAEERTLSH